VIRITVNGNPVAQPRPKAQKRGGFVHIYTPDKKIKPYKQAIQLAARVAMAGHQPLEGPLSVCIIFGFKRPKSHTKKQREDLCHVQKPDLDNLAKAVCDALNEIAWVDDSQVSRMILEKRWSEDEGFTKISICDKTQNFPA
jgi:Holliday junction resolvase RusA-like endonuclease